MNAPSKVQFVVPAAGLGTRLGASAPKALVSVADRPLLIHTLAAIDAAFCLDRAIVLCPEGFAEAFRDVLDAAFPANTVQVIAGGLERQDSVRIGLNAADPGTEIVAVHDAARPFVASDVIRHVIAAAHEHGGATVATPCVDTILAGSDDAFLTSTPDRSTLWVCATPQTFRLEEFRSAHAQALRDGRRFTDDATLFKAYGGTVKLVQGNSSNIKITTAEDLAFAEHLLLQRNVTG